MSDRILDLRDTGGLAPHSYAFYALRELRRGEAVRLLVPDEPRLLMESVALQLRQGIHWRLLEAGPPLWTVEVRRREDVEASDLIDLLTRDHLRIDRLLAEALHSANRGDAEAALSPFRRFAACLRQHLAAENEIIAPRFDLPRSPRGDDPTSIMLREHEEIEQQVVMIEETVDEGAADAATLATFFALLSGQLAKHEGREENNLFPHWERLLKNLQGEEQALFAQVKGLVGEVR